MKNFSIVLKTSLATGLVLALALLLAGAAFFQSEREIIQGIKDKNRTNTSTALDILQQAERTTLERNTRFVTKLVAAITEQYLFDLNNDGLVPVLRSFMDYPEITAIEVYEAGNKPFLAIWRQAGTLEVATVLPPAPRPLHHTQPVTHAAEQLGTVTIYYADEGIITRVAELRQAKEHELAAFEQDIETQLNQSLFTQSLGFAGVTLLLVSAVVVMLVTMVRRPLVGFTREVESIGSDLTRRIPVTRADEVGAISHHFNEFLGQLQQVVGEVKAGIQVVAAGNQQVVANINQLFTTFGAQEQQVQLLTTAMEELRRASASVSASVGAVNETTNDATAKTNDGKHILQEAIGGMEQMNQQMGLLSQSIGRVSESSSHIGKILQVINTLATQTNLLALNAAIEAARAGEAGRGFAVVADEVRKLAAGTQSSTSEIKKIISNLQNETTTLNYEMLVTEVSIQTGVAAIRSADAIFNQIIASVAKINQATTQIDSTSDHQNITVTNLYNSVRTIDHGIQESNSSVTEVRTTVENQSQRVEQLHEQVEKFIV